MGWPSELRTLGDHLRRGRLQRGLTQQEVAELLGVHWNTVTTWELNQKAPVARHVARIHDFLGYCPWDRCATFPERLRRAREALGLGQRELAAELGTSQEVYRDWEKGKYRPSMGFRGLLERLVGPISAQRENDDTSSLPLVLGSA